MPGLLESFKTVSITCVYVSLCVCAHTHSCTHTCFGGMLWYIVEVRGWHYGIGSLTVEWVLRVRLRSSGLPHYVTSPLILWDLLPALCNLNSGRHACKARTFAHLTSKLRLLFLKYVQICLNLFCFEPGSCDVVHSTPQLSISVLCPQGGGILAVLTTPGPSFCFWSL